MLTNRGEIDAVGGGLGSFAGLDTTGPLAGPAGAALASAVPLTGVIGKSALEHLAAQPSGGVDSRPSSPRDGSGLVPFRTEAERRKHALDSKRQNLVDSRMRPQPPGAPDISGPRQPSMSNSKPDPSLGSAHGVSPRRLEID